MFEKIKQFAIQHRVTSAGIILLVFLGLYFGYKGLSGNGQETRYVLAAVEKGTIVVSVSGSGQVSVLDQMDVKPKVSGDVIYVGVKNGQEVRAGTLLVQLDTRDSQKAVRDAEIVLTNAKIQLEKLLLNQDDDVASMEKNIEDAHKNLDRAYQDALNTISTIFLDWPDTIDDLTDVLYEDNIGWTSQQNIGAYQNLVDDRHSPDERIYVYSAETDFRNAEVAYRANFNDYKALGYNPSVEEIEKILGQTSETAKLISYAIKSELNLLDYVVNGLRRQEGRTVPPQITSYQSTLGSYVGQLNSSISSLADTEDSIDDNKEAIVENQKDLEFNEKFNPFDVVSQENAVKQKEAALADAQEDLSNCYVRAPFGGVVAKVNVKNNDSVSGSTVVATVITKQQVAEITLNEIDVAKVKAGQKATLTFDAIPDFVFTGQVAEVDTIGTVSQGVVSYTVKVTFDPVKSLASNGVNTQDERAKPGMSVSAAIVTDVKPDVLIVPNSAVKSQGNAYFVEVSDVKNVQAQTAANLAGILLPQPPRGQQVEIGISNDDSTEVVSGLKEGDIVVARTVTSSSATQTQSTQTKSLFGGGSSGSTRNVNPFR